MVGFMSHDNPGVHSSLQICIHYRTLYLPQSDQDGGSRIRLTDGRPLSSGQKTNSRWDDPTISDNTNPSSTVGPKGLRITGAAHVTRATCGL